MEPDILYAVRRGERNDSLRMSLRSLAHLPHRRVFIAGYCPEWVRNVTVVPVYKRFTNKFAAIEENVRQGLLHPEIGHEIVYMNDDFYVTEPIDFVPIMHGGPITQYAGRQELKARMRNTLRRLQDELLPTQELYTYDGVHVPLPIDKTCARMFLEEIPQGCAWRTYYGNKVGAGGVEVQDAKIRGTHLQGLNAPEKLPTFVSTDRSAFGQIQFILEEVIPSDSPYLAAA